MLHENKEPKQYENGKISPNLVSLPKLPTNKNNYCMDSSLLDFMGADEFLSLMKARTENNLKEIWKEMSSLCIQLKASRELISIGSNIHGNLSTQQDTLSAENLLIKLVQSTQILLGVDRVSVLQFDSSKNELIVVSSNDKQSLGLRYDVTGSAEETVIKKNSAVNIQDISASALAKLESMHKVKINCLLFAPILFGDNVIGVVECINKFSLPLVTPRDLVGLQSVQFNGSDELSLSFISSIIGTVLFDINKKQQNSIANNFIHQKSSQEKTNISVDDSRHRISYSSYMSSLLKTTSVPELCATAESILSKIVESSLCDFMGLYVTSQDYLLRVYSKEVTDPLGGAMKLYELPKAITEALQFSRSEEFISSSSTELSKFIPDANLVSALVVPLKAKFNDHSPGSTILIFGKSSSNQKNTNNQLSSSKKDLLRAFSDCFDCSLQVILNNKYNNSSDSFDNNDILIHSLKALEDFVLILNKEGKIKFRNGDRYGLFINSNTPNNGVVDDLHYSTLINADNTLKLFTDISSGIKSKAYCSSTTTVISPSNPHGVYINYTISPFDKTGDVFVIIRKSQKFEVGDISSNPYAVVDEASSILEKFRKSFSLNDEIDQNLKEITATLSKTSKRMSFLNLNASPLNQTLQLPTVLLVNPNIALPKNMFDWEFNTLEHKDALVLCNVVGEFFNNLVILSDIGINSETLARFILEVAKNYHDRPFHNLQHASGVTHFTYMLLNATNAKENLKQHQLFAILLSAFVHDVDHPGNTNLFEINSNSHLAYLYNDQAVLENHHCATTFKIMRKDSMRILQSLSAPIASDIRKIIIGCVLATDMSIHFDLIEETKKRASSGWNFNEVKDQHILGKILIHAADLSNPVRPFHMSKEWARRIATEFNNQVAKEEALGMPILGFMISKDDKTFCKNEINFASFLVQPMWRAIGTVFPQLDFLLQNLDNNLLEWKAWSDKVILEEQKGEEK